jgi:hypothetical protein
MDKIHKMLLLDDLDNTITNLERKQRKLDMIISYYIDNNKKKEQSKEKNDISTQNNNEQSIDKYQKNENKYTSDNNEKDTNNKSQEKTSNNKKEIFEKNENIDLPKDIKAIYRKIMLKTHPDKTKIAEHISFYEKAVIAKDTNDYATLLMIAFLLKIDDVYELDIKYFNKIKFHINRMEQKFTQIVNNPFWVWYHTDNQIMKDIMIKQINKLL